MRKLKEHEALRSLGTAQRNYQNEIAKKKDLVDRLNETLIKLEHLGSSSTVQGSLLFSVQKYIEGTKLRILHSEQAISRAKRGVEKALRFYLVAMKQTRVIETLREQDYKNYRKTQTLKEQKELEDLMIMRNRLKVEESEGSTQ